MVNVDPNAGAAKWSVAGATEVYLTGLNGKGGVPAGQLVLGVPLPLSPVKYTSVAPATDHFAALAFGSTFTMGAFNPVMESQPP